MKYQNENLREMLAAEYVLGTLHGAARRRFVRLLKSDPALQCTVTEWEERLSPMASAAPPVEPPARVWRAIQARIGRRKKRGIFESLTFWRALAMTTSALSLALATYIGLAPLPEVPPSTIAVLSDSKAQPAMLVSWPTQTTSKKQIRIKIILEHREMAPNTSWELWMLPGGTQPPVSMGLVSLELKQTLILPEGVSQALPKAWGMALSVEPKAGSPTGQPTGPVLYQGQCVKML